MRFPVNVPIEENPFFDRLSLRVQVDRDEGISWCSFDETSFYFYCGEQMGNGKWKYSGDSTFCVAMEEPKDELADCSVANAINGCSRIMDRGNYKWVSDHGQNLPQWLRVDFKEPEEINTVSVVFDTNLSVPGTCWISKILEVPECVRDYSIEGFTGTEWILMAEETGNFIRRRVHRFETMRLKVLRVTVKATWSDPSARTTTLNALKENR